MLKRRMLWGVGGGIAFLLAAIGGCVVAMTSWRHHEVASDQITKIASANYISEAALPKEKYTVLFDAYSDACNEGCKVSSFQTCTYKIDETNSLLTVLWVDEKGIVQRVLLATPSAKDPKAQEQLKSQLQAQLNKPANRPLQVAYPAQPPGISAIYQIDARNSVPHTGGSLLKKHSSPASFYLQSTVIQEGNATSGIFFYWETDTRDYILAYGAYGS